MLGRQAMHRVLFIGEFGRSLEEGHAAEIRRGDPFLDEIEQLLQFLRRFPGVAGEFVAEPGLEVLVTALQHFQDQLFLAAEILVERHLGGAGDRHDGIHARGVDAAGLEQFGRYTEDLFA